jgi:hypothetical protein
MRASLIYKTICCSLLLALLVTVKSFGQSYDDDDRPVLQDEFCQLLKKIINDKPNNYANLADTITDEEMPQVSMDGVAPVREDVTFVQARRSMLVGSGSTTKYRTVFMIRDSRDALVPSYNNLLSMLKDCLYFHYEFHETSYLNMKEIASLGYKTYENIGKPRQINGEPQSDIYFMIQKNRQSGQFELVLEIR